MKIKEFTISKKLLTNIGNFSNIEVSHSITVEVGKGETPDWDEAYDVINQNLLIESDNIDATWIKKDELKNEYKLTIKLPKRGGDSNATS